MTLTEEIKEQIESMVDEAFDVRLMDGEHEVLFDFFKTLILQNAHCINNDGKQWFNFD